LVVIYNYTNDARTHGRHEKTKLNNRRKYEIFELMNCLLGYDAV